MYLYFYYYSSYFLFFIFYLFFLEMVLFFGVWGRHGSAMRRMLSHNLFFSARNFTEGWVTAAAVLLIGEIDPRLICTMQACRLQAAPCIIQLPFWAVHAISCHHS